MPVAEVTRKLLEYIEQKGLHDTKAKSRTADNKDETPLTPAGLDRKEKPDSLANLFVVCPAGGGKTRLLREIEGTYPTPLADFSKLWKTMRRHRAKGELKHYEAMTLVCVDEHLTQRNKARLAELVMDGVAVVAGPHAADDFVWEMKANANSRGAIFEVAESEGSFVRLIKVATEAVSRRAISLSGQESLEPQNLDRIRSDVFMHVLRHFAKHAPSAEEKSGLLAGNPAASAVSVEHVDRFEDLPGVAAATADLRSPSGRLDADRVAELFGLSRADIARLTGRTAEAIRQTPDASSLQAVLQVMERCARMLVLNNDRTLFRTWLNTANPELGEEMPITLIKAGRSEIVANLVEDIITNRAH